MSSNAASALAAPVIMFFRNSLWPGASMITYCRLSVRNQICAVSMVMFWSRSDWRASIKLAHSKGTPRRSAICRSCSSFPSGSEPVSWNKRPTKVDLPWSTWPTMTILSCSLGAWLSPAALRGASHVSIASEFFEGIFTFLVLGAARTLGSIRAPQLLNNFAHRFGVRLDRERAGRAAQAAVTLAFAVGKIKRDHGNILALDVLPYIQLGPVEQGMDANVRPFGEIGFELVPQLRRLVFDVPLHVLVARAEITLLGAGWFLIAAHSDDDAREVVFVQDLLKAVLFKRAAAFDARGFAVWISDAALERRFIFADNQFQFPFLYQAVAIFNHRRDFVGGIDVDERKGD